MLHGVIRKLRTRLASPVQYALPVGGESLPLNSLLGHSLDIRWDGAIECIHCGRAIKKSFAQGFCFPCFRRLAQCDRCVVSPELCHYEAGTCREPEWGERHCLIEHTVYLANSSGLKVGITRGVDATARWIDQGAAEALSIRIVPSRLAAGQLEVALKEFVSDKTNWRRMLRGVPTTLDLEAERDRLLHELTTRHPGFAIPGHEPAAGTSIARIEYPVLQYPTRVTSHNLDKQPQLSGELVGIKGQYLIFDSAVISMRKYAGYVLSIESGPRRN